jgi:hypothetical protein
MGIILLTRSVYLKKVQPENKKALFVFGDGLTIKFDSFPRGVSETISKGMNLPVFGGTCVDNGVYKQTYQYCNDKVASDSVVRAMEWYGERPASFHA